MSTRKKTEAEIVFTRERLNLALVASGLALFEWDILSGAVYLSEQWSLMLGGKAEPTQTTFPALENLVHPDDKAQLGKLIYDVLKGHASHYRAEHRVQTLSGGWLWIQSYGQIVARNENGLALRMIGTNADISERKRLELQLIRLAQYDSLTGLPNRNLFHDRLTQALSRSKRNKELMSLMYLDIDQFKKINDELGHSIGDAMLHGFAQRLKQCVRDTDTVARLAGDEFAIIMEGLHQPEDAKRGAEKILNSMSTAFSLEHCQINVSASIGIAFFGGSGDLSGDVLVKMADSAMYRAKQKGRNNYVVYEFNVPGATGERP
ncbi:MAG: diguanylate cyclase domain-containing protein [Burkholderiales bacterium]